MKEKERNNQDLLECIFWDFQILYTGKNWNMVYLNNFGLRPWTLLACVCFNYMLPSQQLHRDHKRTKGSIEDFMSYYIQHKTEQDREWSFFVRICSWNIKSDCSKNIFHRQEKIHFVVGWGGRRVPEGRGLIYWGKHCSVDTYTWSRWPSTHLHL